jgi:hypothetical protein
MDELETMNEQLHEELRERSIRLTVQDEFAAELARVRRDAEARRRVCLRSSSASRFFFDNSSLRLVGA